jgi:hypothetical protein
MFTIIPREIFGVILEKDGAKVIERTAETKVRA